MSHKRTVTHYRSKCIGCGSCVLEAPQCWSIHDEDGLSFLKGAQNKGQFWVGKIEAGDLEDVKRAAESCPVRIIRIVE